MKYDAYGELDTPMTEAMSEDERVKILMGFEFVNRRIKELLQHERNFDADDHALAFEFYDEVLRVRWNWTEYTRCGDTETHHETRRFPYEAIFSVTAEEQHRIEEANRIAVERQQREREEHARQERLRIQREAEQERKERGELARLKQKYETN